MEYNTAFTYPTWDKSYVKMLHVIANKTPCTWQDIANGMLRLNAVPTKQVLKGFMLAHAVAEVGKAGRSKLYALTDKGMAIYQKALSTRDIVEMLEFAAQYQTYLEFKVNATLIGHAEWNEVEFWTKSVMPVLSALQGIPERNLMRRLHKLPFFADYASAMANANEVKAVS